LIESRNKGQCLVIYKNLPADDMFLEISKKLDSQSRNVRNLIFIDPYGYKEIKKDTLEGLLRNRRTEIILFLPISQMRRFTMAALSSDLKAYEPLKEFVDSFFAADHPIRTRTVPSVQYIQFITEALKFSLCYATSYQIERDESNYYSLFFISPHIYGFEKILEVKWQLDEDSGRGFKQPEAMPSMFEAQERDLQKEENYARLEKLLKEFLIIPRTNKEVYEFTLLNEFLPKHTAEIFRNWQDTSRNFRVVDSQSRVPVPKRRFYLSWDWYDPAKNSNPKVVYTFD
jgi:hypothetical protein